MFNSFNYNTSFKASNFPYLRKQSNNSKSPKLPSNTRTLCLNLQISKIRQIKPKEPLISKE